MDCIERDIIESELQIYSASHRTACHCLLLVATTIEPDFLSYILLHTHNREALRYYLNHILRHELCKMLQGGFDRQNASSVLPEVQDTKIAKSMQMAEVPFEVASFVNNSRHMYAVYCAPRYPCTQ